jgi:hypothetical protein
MIRYQLGIPINISETTLLTIERLSIAADSGKSSCWLNVTKEPYAVVIRTANGVQALDMAGQPLAITGLNDLVSGLDQALSG